MSSVVGMAIFFTEGTRARGMPKSVKPAVENSSALWCSTPYCLITSSFGSESSGKLRPSRSLLRAASSMVSLLRATTSTSCSARRSYIFSKRRNSALQ